MSIFGGKIAPALLVPPYGTNPQRSALESDLIDVIAHAPTIDVTEGPSFPDDTQLFIRSVEQHFTVHNPVTQSNFGYTFPLPAGVKRTGLDRDAFVVIISVSNIATTTDWPQAGDAFASQNPGWDDFNVAQEWRRTVPNNTLLKSTLLRRRPDGTANDFFVIPADYQFHNFSVTFIVFGQNSTTPQTRITGSHLAGFNADSSNVWDISSFATWPTDFNCMEVMYANKRFTTSTPANYLGALTLAPIDQTGGWLELVSATDQSQYPNVGDDAQNNQWVQCFARFLVTSPDANSTIARTFTYGPAHGNSPNFACYFRFELGF
jgi:hypothetical protein